MGGRRVHITISGLSSSLTTMTSAIPRALQPSSSRTYAVQLVSRLSTSSTCQSSSNDNAVRPMIKNRNPMNLEKMRIGFKPSGFPTEKRNRNYWNSLDLELSNHHTTATVTHWTGRKVCSASTKEWAIRKFLYNYTDSAALKCVGAVVGQRCLETGITEVTLQIEPKDLEKDRMANFVQAIKDTGLILEEPDQYKPLNPHADLHDVSKVPPAKPWEIVDQ